MFKKKWIPPPPLPPPTPTPPPSPEFPWHYNLQEDVSQRLLKASEFSFTLGWKSIWELNTAPFIGACFAFCIASLISPNDK